MNIGEQINGEISRQQYKFCEDLCPYKFAHASYDEDYELPCMVGQCYVQEFKEYLTK